MIHLLEDPSLSNLTHNNTFPTSDSLCSFNVSTSALNVFNNVISTAPSWGRQFLRFNTHLEKSIILKRWSQNMKLTPMLDAPHHVLSASTLAILIGIVHVLEQSPLILLQSSAWWLNLLIKPFIPRFKLANIFLHCLCCKHTLPQTLRPKPCIVLQVCVPINKVPIFIPQNKGQHSMNFPNSLFYQLGYGAAKVDKLPD